MFFRRRLCGCLSCRFRLSLSIHLATLNRTASGLIWTRQESCYSSSDCWLKRTPTFRSSHSDKIPLIRGNFATTVSLHFNFSPAIENTENIMFTASQSTCDRPTVNNSSEITSDWRKTANAAVEISVSPLKAFRTRVLHQEALNIFLCFYHDSAAMKVSDLGKAFSFLDGKR